MFPKPNSTPCRHTAVAALCLALAAPLCGCSGAASATSAAAATLITLSVPIVPAGAPTSTITLTGTGISTSASLLIDGTAHTATILSATQLQVTLSATDLTKSGRRALQVVNPSATASNTLTLLVSPAYTAFGDSMTYGYTLASPTTQAYPYLLAQALSLPITDLGFPGDGACDVFPTQIFGGHVGYTASPGSFYSLMIGSNDVDTRGTGAYEAVFNLCDSAALYWLGTERPDKLLPGDAAIQATGACSSAPSTDAAYFGGMPCNGTGTITASIATTGNPIYIWYLISDNAAATATFTTQIDGAATTAASTVPPVSITTLLGGHVGMASQRIATTTGSHTVKITASTGAISILGIGSNRGSATRPQLVIGDLPNQRIGQPTAPVADQLTYSADIQANLATALADGIDIHFAADRQYFLGNPNEMNDLLHANILGHQELEEAFFNALQ